MHLRKRLGVLSFVVLGLLGGGVATASWLASGMGPAAAQAVTVQPLSVSPGSPSATLYPVPSGGYSSTLPGTITATVSNANPFPVSVTSVALGAVSVTPLGNRTCAASNVVPASATPVTLSPPLLLQPNASNVVLTVPGALQMVSGAEDGCQGATIGVVLTVSGAPV